MYQRIVLSISMLLLYNLDKPRETLPECFSQEYVYGLQLKHTIFYIRANIHSKCNIHEATVPTHILIDLIAATKHNHPPSFLHTTAF